MTASRLLIIIFFLIVTCIERVSAQADKEKDIFPLTIPIIEIYDLDTTYHTLWKTKSIPPRKVVSINDFIYRLVITITIIGEETWNKSFALRYELPGNNREFIVVNEERYELLPDTFNQFIVEVRTKQKGWAKFELAIYDEVTGGAIVPVNSYPLRGRDFLLE